METSVSTCFLIVLSFFVGCQGMEFTMNRDQTVSPSGRKSCGVLVCEEVVQDRTPTSGFHGDKNRTDAKVSQRSVSEMSIYQHAITSSDTGSADGPGLLVASLNLNQRRVNRVADGMEVVGQLASGGATLRLTLYKHEACGAEYTCRVVLVSAKGEEHVSTSRLLQQRFHDPRDGGDCRVQARREEWAPAITLKLFSLLHQTENKLSQVLSAWPVSLQALETRLQDTMKSMENRLEAKITSEK
ncbi:hypothetical protein EGW08_006367, partial [Elysia chlorotica]